MSDEVRVKRDTAEGPAATRRGKGLPPEAYEEVPWTEYEPYVPASVALPEFTLRAVLFGALVGVVFGAANAYLGLRVGLTVSASIPAAVMGVAFLRALRTGTVLEGNTIQTVGSAGESLAGGVIFTIPALFVFGLAPSQLLIFTLAALGGLLGVLYMIPLRRFLIRDEHGRLPYPEGTACAEVLAAGDSGGSKARLLFGGLGAGALYQYLSNGNALSLWNSDPAFRIGGYPKAEVGLAATPELLGVGYIIGPRIAAKARVAWCRPEDGGYLIGAAFRDASDAFRSRMVQQVCSIENYRKEMREKEGRSLTTEQASAEWIESARARLLGNYKQQPIVLERGELKLSFEAGRFRIRYHDHLFPVSPRSSSLVAGAVGPRGGDRSFLRRL